MKSYIVRQIGQHRGSPRLYLDIPDLEKAGLKPGATYGRAYTPESQRLTLRLDMDGAYTVSKKEKHGKTCPVIDINSSELLAAFVGLEAVRIIVAKNMVHIMPMASEVKRRERLTRLAKELDAGVLQTGSVAHGGGVLDHAAHSGLADAGIRSELAMANEIDEDLLAHAQAVNDIWSDKTVAIAAPLQELVQDDWAMAKLPQISLFCAGVPCSGASVAGKSKRGLVAMENHPQVGHLIAGTIMVINRLQPACIVIENVTAYQDTASAQILRQQLRDSGYRVQETILKAQDFGVLENRIRWFLVAATDPIEIDIASIAPTVKPVRVLSEVLEDVALDSPKWRPVPHLKAKEETDKAKGSSFAMQMLTPQSDKVPVIRALYNKAGSTDPRLLHPEDASLSRLLTPIEHARIKEVPAHLIEGLSETDAHKLMGQGIAYRPVRELFRVIGLALLAWRAKAGAAFDKAAPISYDLMRATG